MNKINDDTELSKKESGIIIYLDIEVLNPLNVIIKLTCKQCHG